MHSFTETFDRCRALLEESNIQSVLDATLIIAPTDDQLQVLLKVISTLRTSLKGAGSREIAPEDAYEVYLTLAHAFLHRGLRTERFNEAFDAATSAMELYPLRSRGYRIRGHIGLLRGRKNDKWLARAASDFDRALRYDQNDSVSRYSRALCYEMPALQRLRTASTLREQGKLQRASHLISDAECALGDAVVHWTSLLESQPDHGLALLHRGVCLARLGELEKARSDLDGVCRIGMPSLSWSQGRSEEMLAEAHIERARIASAQGRFVEALDDLREAQSVSPDGFDTVALTERAEISLKAREFEAVVEDCSTILEDHDDRTALILRARAHFNLGHFDLSRADTSRILNHDVGDVEARFLRGRCAAELGAIQSSLVDLDTCVEMSPQRGEALATRAKVRLEAGSYAEALGDAMDAFELLDDKGGVLHTLGYAHYHLGHRDEARLALVSAHKAGNPEATEKLKKWYGEDP